MSRSAWLAALAAILVIAVGVSIVSSAPRMFGQWVLFALQQWHNTAHDRCYGGLCIVWVDHPPHRT